MSRNNVPTANTRKNGRAIHVATPIEAAESGEGSEITFGYYTFFKPNPDTYLTLFSVTTRKYIPLKTVEKLLRQAIPGCRIGSDPQHFMGFINIYKRSHSFDVRTPKPMRLRDFTETAYKALKDHT